MISVPTFFGLSRLGSFYENVRINVKAGMGIPMRENGQENVHDLLYGNAVRINIWLFSRH